MGARVGFREGDVRVGVREARLALRVGAWWNLGSGRAHLLHAFVVLYNIEIARAKRLSLASSTFWHYYGRLWEATRKSAHQQSRLRRSSTATAQDHRLGG